MRRFLGKSAIFFFLVFILGLMSLAFVQDGKVDKFYARFTSPRQQSLIIGSSLGAIGIRPGVLNESLEPLASKNMEIYNYCFSIRNSPYGSPYLNAIKKKLAETSNEGLFLVEVNPWAMKIPKHMKDPGRWPEQDLPPGNMSFVTMRPNVEYLFRNYPHPWYYAVLGKESDWLEKVHDNGWMEIRVVYSRDNYLRAVERKTEMLAATAEASRMSPRRLDYLERIIAFLKTRGRVILVKTPVNKEIAAVEKRFAPNFGREIRGIARRQEVVYLDYSRLNGRFQTIDGNHLTPAAAGAFTKLLSQDLLDGLQISVAF